MIAMEEVGKMANALGSILSVPEAKVLSARELIEHSRYVVLVGTGKSFIAAQYGASLLQSVGVPAVAVHATDMLHGSLGLDKLDTTVILLSHSGETPETLAPVDHLAACKVIGITGDDDSRLAHGRCDIILDYKTLGDGSNHGTLPIASFMAQCAWIGLIAALIANDMAGEDLAMLHPGGTLYES